MLLSHDSNLAAMTPTSAPSPRPQAWGPPATRATPPPPKTDLRHVILLIETSGSYGRGLLQGIAKYNRDRGRWSTYCRPISLADAPPDWLCRWRGDGILARIENQAMARIARESGAAI